GGENALVPGFAADTELRNDPIAFMSKMNLFRVHSSLALFCFLPCRDFGFYVEYRESQNVSQNICCNARGGNFL
ncbi:MAG: hypothetical protein IJ631_01415, partial [Schwartzia sp.]|nr:hypothetical protein [Schwartzia sp. (in: firmicutes)]